MTYQELLEEFDKRRTEAFALDNEAAFNNASISNHAWAIQSILEKLRDGDKT